MSMTNGGDQPQLGMPQIAVLTQYVKDLSFENPHAPRSLAPSAQQPTINIQVNVDAAPMSETDFEVTLRAEGKAESQNMLLFGFELVFAGIFRVQNVPADSVQPVELIGARQAQLVLSQSAVPDRAPGAPIVIRERPLPLAARITAEERAAHRRFVATLSKSAIWLDYFSLD